METKDRGAKTQRERDGAGSEAGQEGEAGICFSPGASWTDVCFLAGPTLT